MPFALLCVPAPDLLHSFIAAEAGATTTHYLGRSERHRDAVCPGSWREKGIGVGDYDHFPAEVEKKPRLGGLINPDIEKIISMHPDLVITYGTQDVLQKNLQSVGIRMFPFVHGNVEQTLQFLLELGHTTGADDQARQLVDEIRKTFDDVRAHAPPAARKVLLVTGRTAGTLGSFYSVGRRAFQHDLIEIAGGRNIFADVDQEAIQPSLEGSDQPETGCHY